ncbi:MAG: hypothetical protein ACLVJ6_11335 [Merdibacter sp.]
MKVDEIAGLYQGDAGKYNYDFTSMPSLFGNFRIHLQFAIKRLLVDYQLTIRCYRK